jgi:hypothetical protein
MTPSSQGLEPAISPERFKVFELTLGRAQRPPALNGLAKSVFSPPAQS